ncbi:NACHT, LRR and PYD domains-containing protein 4 [Trichechus manatus latirostris]|uniref:NACHT, LRR and PYD domains-containing protein 4 n=1 Tax=Trichechus manatus latirostris TaxID=127582 RepID=A0A2Y9DWN7_TRIMA|nr:NACHT, LRR and PYD domains-containing protein 4 [Trichechus manatus latirostris]
MASSFFSDFGLMWYLDELKKEEFRRFKELLRQEPLQLGLERIPWAEVKRATREDLANLLIKHYQEQQAWDVTYRIFHKIGRKDLHIKAKRESTGYIRMYQAHVKKKFSNIWSRESLTRIHDYFEQEVVIQKKRERMELLFEPKATGEEPSRTVVLVGTPKIGKTTFLVKLMLAWAEGIFYQDRFLYIFYFCCWEVKRLALTSLAELISGDWPNPPVPIAEILSQPERLLFIIDSFEELTCALKEPESDLCSDWLQQQPGEVVLGSLLRKKMLPEASLLIATTPNYQQELEAQLEHPEIKTIMGLNESDRKLYFSCVFQDKKQAMEAFSFVRENEQLFHMCQIPILCWVVCTCLKQEMERGRDLALACHRTTSLFASFIFNMFTPKGATRPHEQIHVQLKGLCSLAVEGMWTDTFQFSEEDFRRNGLVESDIPALLDMKLLQKCRGYENSYTFIHVCIQEFCAAMFYLLKSSGNHPNPAVGCSKALLLTYLKRENVHWILGGCFVFGLLNAEEEKRLDAFFDLQLSLEVKQQFHQCLKSLGECEHLEGEVDFLLFYCLFEMQDKVFVTKALDCFQEVHFSVTDNVDLMVSAYCLKHCSGLRKISFSVRNVFKEENGDSSTSSYNLVRWHYICSVLTTNVHLRELQVHNSVLDESAFGALCKELRHPNCHLQKLEINNVSFSGESWLFFEVFIHNPYLKCLDLSSTRLYRNDVRLLCEALNYPLCNIEDLTLANCLLSAGDCEAFASVLKSNKKLKYLNVAHNYLDQGVSLLCDALCHLDCVLEALVLVYCYLSEPCWDSLCEVLVCNRSLIHLDLGGNVLKDDDLELLCAALKHPNCCLQSLCLVKVSITDEGCRDIASVLTSNPNLRNLDIGNNDIQDEGVKLLCEALTHPNCHLENLGLDSCQLTSACCEDLASALTQSKTLRRLSLTGNTLDHDGVVVLCEGLRHTECALRMLRLQKAKFGEETQRLLMAEDERNPSLTIIIDNY